MIPTEEEQEMLHIFADALLIATRMQPLPDQGRPYRRDAKSDEQTRRRWFGLTGLLR